MLTVFGLNSIAVGAGGTVLRSENGLNWTKIPSGTAANLKHIAFGNGFFIAVGQAGAILLSTDGESWTLEKLPNPSPNSTQNSFQLFGSAFGAGKIVLIGSSMFESNLAEGILSDPSFGPDGFGFGITGEIGRTFRIEATTRLTPPDWISVGSVTNDRSTAPFFDPSARSSARRFYHVVTDRR